METQAAVSGVARLAAVPDAEIVRRVVAGDRAVFEVLMRRHNPRVYRTIRSLLRDEAEVEDAMQQSYLLAYTHLAEFAGSSSFVTWLTRIALNEALGRLRRRTRLSLVDLPATAEDDEVISNQQTPEEDAASRETAVLLERSIDQLPELYRTVLMLRDVEQLSTAEAAEVLGVTEETVRIRLHRGRRALREALAAEVGKGVTHAFQFLAPRCNRVVAAVMAALPDR